MRHFCRPLTPFCVTPLAKSKPEIHSNTSVFLKSDIFDVPPLCILPSALCLHVQNRCMGQKNFWWGYRGLSPFPFHLSRHLFSISFSSLFLSRRQGPVAGFAGVARYDIVGDYVHWIVLLCRPDRSGHHLRQGRRQLGKVCVLKSG